MGHTIAHARPTPADAFPGAHVVETHTSWVFLTGDRAWKVKKPVTFPFLDYGTPDLRRHFCEEEVRLNRRLAPSIYLGVRAIAGGEHAVEMLRVPEEDTLAARVAGGRAGTTDIRAVAERLARFHASAEIVAEPEAGAFEGQLQSSLGELADLAPGAQAMAGLGPLLSAACLRLGPELEARAAGGLVRDGHGDLRAEHVVLWDPIEIFDCIEFNAGLRRIDVGCDLAFLAMDLEHRGAPDLSAELVRAYRAAGGDPGSDRLMALFAGYRALVRAKVALIRAGQLEGPARAAATADAGSLLALARGCAWRTAFPLVLVVCGGAATGKTTLARRLADLSGMRRVGSDATRKRLAGLAPTARAPAGAYSDAMNRRTYAELGALAAEELKRAGGVIVDATFRRRADREAFAAALPAGAEPLFVECRAPAATVAERAAERALTLDSESDADATVALRHLAEFEPLEEAGTGRHIAVNTARPAAEAAAMAEEAVIADAPASGLR